MAAGYQWPTEEDPASRLGGRDGRSHILGDIVVQMEGGPGSEQLVEALEEADTRLREAESQHLGIVQLAELFLGHYESMDDYMLVDHAMYARDINAPLPSWATRKLTPGCVVCSARKHSSPNQRKAVVRRLRCLRAQRPAS